MSFNEQSQTRQIAPLNCYRALQTQQFFVDFLNVCLTERYIKLKSELRLCDASDSIQFIK